MKKRETFIGKVKEACVQHAETIITAVVVVVGIALCILLGFLLSLKIIGKPMSDEQFTFCEQVARDVYEKGNQLIVEVPEEVNINKTETTITVSLNHNVGSVDAKLKDGELVFIRYEGKEVLIGTTLLFGLFFVMLGFCLLALFICIYDKVKKSS